MIDSPKTRFQLDKDSTNRLAETVASSWFQKSLDAAMLQFIAELPNPENAAPAFQVKGAKDFIRVLTTLSDQHKEITQPRSGLDYHA